MDEYKNIKMTYNLERGSTFAMIQCDFVIANLMQHMAVVGGEEGEHGFGIVTLILELYRFRTFFTLQLAD